MFFLQFDLHTIRILDNSFLKLSAIRVSCLGFDLLSDNLIIEIVTLTSTSSRSKVEKLSENPIKKDVLLSSFGLAGAGSHEERANLGAAKPCILI